MRVLVCGGRDFSKKNLLYNTLDQYNITELCHGGARGADSLADQWAQDNNIPQVIFPANWKKYGKKAGPYRNYKMLQEFDPDLIIAFPGGAGTGHMVRISREAGKEVVCISF